MIQATYEDAKLIMDLYQLRREERLRKARDWFQKEMSAASLKEYREKYPPGSEQDAFFGMVIGYWEMASAFLAKGIVHEELFLETNGELWTIWEKAKPLVEEYRGLLKNPALFGNLEKAAARYIAWTERNAPGSYEAMKALSGQ